MWSCGMDDAHRNGVSRLVSLLQNQGLHQEHDWHRRQRHHQQQRLQKRRIMSDARGCTASQSKADRKQGGSKHTNHMRR